MNIENCVLLLSAQVVVKGAIIGISGFVLFFVFHRGLHEVALKCMPRVQHAHLSSFNQSN